MPEIRRCPLCEDPIPKDRTLLLCDFCHKKSWKAEPNGRGDSLAYSDIPKMKRERGDA